MFLVFAAVAGVSLAGLACYGICLAVGLTFGATHAGLIFLMLGKKLTVYDSAISSVFPIMYDLILHPANKPM